MPLSRFAVGFDSMCAVARSVLTAISTCFLRAVVMITLCLPLFSSAVTPAMAQRAGGQNRATKVGVEVVETRILADFTDVQARIVAAPADTITATTNAITEIRNWRLGDMVAPGDVIARQDRSRLDLKLSQLKAKLAEAKIKLADSEAEITAEAGLLAVARTQAKLLTGKADRARGLAANNALPIDAAETAQNASLTANLAVLARESAIARKSAQVEIAKVSMAQLEDEIAQTTKDVKATNLTSRVSGQIVFLADYRRGYAREGEMIAKIMDLDKFEIEAEIPVGYLPLLESAKKVNGRGLDGKTVDLSMRVALPVQNTRTATRTIRFHPDSELPASMRAVNAVVVVQVPVTSPAAQVIVPKDAVLPVTGGHMVYLAVEGKARRQIIQLGGPVAGGFIVKKGLAAGQTVIVRGNEQLSDGKDIETGGKSKGDKSKGDKSKGDKSKGDKSKGGKNGKPAAVDAAGSASEPTTGKGGTN